MTDRLSLIDASFLERESPRQPLHTGGLAIFEPGLSFGAVLSALEARLDRIPRARQVVHDPGPVGGRLAWVDDVHFDLSYHLRHSALPGPGDAAQLGEFLARLMGRPLDRTRPLWELYAIEGLEGGRWGLFRKVHLTMAGGNHGDPFSVLLDDTDDVQDEPQRPWTSRRPPTQLTLAAEAARERVERLGDVASSLSRVAATPRRILRAGSKATEAAIGMALRTAGSRPRSPLSGPQSSHRRFATVRLELDDLRHVRRAFGGTINDAVVAVVGDAIGRLLRWRGYETKDMDLRVMVPVRVHEDGEPDDIGLGEAPTVGDGVVGVVAPLPVMDMDPVARLYRIMGEFAGLKESRQAVAAEHLVRLAGYAPPNLHAMAARAASADDRYNVALSNAPGPQEPRFLRGVRLDATYPFIPLSGGAGLSVAVSSYAGGVFVGLLGDRAAMSDLDHLATFVSEAVAELVDAADEVPTIDGTRPEGP